MAEDDEIYWQDTLEAVLAGRTTGLKCPFCYVGNIIVTKRERATMVRCDEDGCGHYIEGRFSHDDVAEG